MHILADCPKYGQQRSVGVRIASASGLIAADHFCCSSPAQKKMKMRLIASTAVMVACVTALAQCATIYGVQRRRSTEDLDDADRQWWLSAIITKKRSSPSAPDPTDTKNYYYYLYMQRKVVDLFI